MTPSRVILLRAALLGAMALLVVGAPVAAHADLETSDPAEGESVAVAPPEVSGVFTEPLDRDVSRLVLFDEAGQRLGEGGVDAEDETATTMRLEPPALAPGVYEVRWTARTPNDGFVERGRWSFTVAGAAQSPSPIASDGQSPSASGTPATPTTPVNSPSPSPIASAPASPVTSPVASPIVPDGNDSGPLGGAAVPLLALGAVAAAAVLYLARRPR